VLLSKLSHQQIKIYKNDYIKSTNKGLFKTRELAHAVKKKTWNVFGDSGHTHTLQMFENFVNSFIKSSVVLGYRKLVVLLEMKSMSNLLTISYVLPEGINQLTQAVSALLVHCSW